MVGPSMLPTFEAQGDVVLELRQPLMAALGRANIERGDLIVYESPAAPALQVCKRVIGLPGDIICVDPTGMRAPSTEHVVVPRGHVWVAGDNADNSRDSRYYGPVPLALVSGFVWARVWPPRRWTFYGKRRSAVTYLE
ncbi:signal peptidase I family protein [Vararia minispora EC-137]|uniref:Signal peptidase I family protein n=1 Tax=Vararia minispora EC-137 TaxID=1314806 RepID=A0ACB8QYN3_9AGAM|nr:signal peptidase I family protein [Vararia minispora EC-137]